MCTEINMEIGLKRFMVVLYLSTIAVDSGSGINTNTDALEERIREALKVLLLSDRHTNSLPTLNEDVVDVEGDMLDEPQKLEQAFLTANRKRNYYDNWDWGDDAGNRATSGPSSTTLLTTIPSTVPITTTPKQTTIKTSINWPKIKFPSWWSR